MYLENTQRKKDNKWTARPVCTDVSSITNGLRKWVDQMLQQIASAQQSYFKDSFALKETISKLELPPGALLFTCYAKSMHINIPTEPSLTVISNYICAAEVQLFHHYNLPTLNEALQIVFQNNFIQFGDTDWQETSGMGMGISPAPP